MKNATAPTLHQLETQLRAARFDYDIARNSRGTTPEALADMLDGIRALAAAVRVEEDRRYGTPDRVAYAGATLQPASRKAARFLAELD